MFVICVEAIIYFSLYNLHDCTFKFPYYMMLIIKLNQTTVTAFCENSKVVSSDFSMTKNIVAQLSLSSLPINFICCYKSGFSNSICLFKSIAISL